MSRSYDAPNPVYPALDRIEGYELDVSLGARRRSDHSRSRDYPESSLNGRPWFAVSGYTRPPACCGKVNGRN